MPSSTSVPSNRPSSCLPSGLTRYWFRPSLYAANWSYCGGQENITTSKVLFFKFEKEKLVKFRTKYSVMSRESTSTSPMVWMTLYPSTGAPWTNIAHSSLGRVHGREHGVYLLSKKLKDVFGKVRYDPNTLPNTPVRFGIRTRYRCRTLGYVRYAHKKYPGYPYTLANAPLKCCLPPWTEM